MKVVDVVKRVKEIHKNYVVIVKIGNFCHTYGKDSYIISYLFEYKTKILEENISTCGFPLTSLNKVISKLENKKINYIMLDRRNNYEVDLKYDNKNLNEYEETFKVARVYVNYKKRIDDINKFLIDNVQEEDFKEILKEMEEIVNGRRKV